MALSKAASLVKKSTASLSVSATAHSTQRWTPHSNCQSASDVKELKHEANSYAESYVYFQLVTSLWLQVTKALPVSGMDNHRLT